LFDRHNSSDEADENEAHETPVTLWLRQLEAGDSQAADALYQHFCTRLRELAGKRIPANIRSAYDQDDAAVSAFHSLFIAVREQRYHLHDRLDFWRLLLTIAERKIAKRVRFEQRHKRDVRRLVQNSVFLRLPTDSGEDDRGLEALEGREPTPEFAAEVSDTCEALLGSLPDDDSRQIALLKLENYTADEIASKLGCARRTVQRRLLVIRRTWQHASGIETAIGDVSRLDNEGA
jgi:RNA polymerase sigma factor (sigma-70 family)